MSNEPTPPHGTMEGSGAYNKHAYVPASGAALALPLLERAARNVLLDAGDHPIVVADYGSSQGENSLLPMRIAIGALRARVGPNRPISVFHIDQPSNDFNTLFEVLGAHPDRYILDDPNVFPGAIGTSFYENVLPPDSVHLGWCSYAAVWLSRIPEAIPGHFAVLGSTGKVRTEFDSQGAQDWESFLSLRAKELRSGGRLVVVLPGRDDNGSTGFEGLFDHANAVLAEMVDEGAILAAERARMVLGAYPRRRCDLLAPFAPDGQFRNLIVEHCDTYVLPDAAWADFERDKNSAVLAAKQALFFRSTFLPSLATGLVANRDVLVCHAFGDVLENGLKRRLSSQPAPVQSFVQGMVVAKQA